MIVYALKIRQENDWCYINEVRDDTEVGRIFASHAIAKKYCKEFTSYGALFGTRHGELINWCLVNIKDDDTYIYKRPIDESIDDENRDPYKMTIQIVARGLVTDENPLYKIKSDKEREDEGLAIWNQLYDEFGGKAHVVSVIKRDIEEDEECRKIWTRFNELFLERRTSK